MKRIIYIAPISAISGNISGRQLLTYDGVPGYNVPTGEKVAADGYQPRLIAQIRAWGTRYQRNQFQVRTKSSVNMTEAMKNNLALMGGSGAIFAAVISDKTSQIYKDCVRACPKINTLRGWLVPIIRQGLANKSATIVITQAISINNPWVSGGTGVVVNIPQSVIDKFDSVLSNT